MVFAKDLLIVMGLISVLGGQSAEALDSRPPPPPVPTYTSPSANPSPHQHPQANPVVRVTNPPLPSPSSLSQASAPSSSLANPLPQRTPEVFLELMNAVNNLLNAVNNLSPLAKAFLNAARVAPEQFLKYWSMLPEEKAVAVSQEILPIEQLMSAPVQASPQSNVQQTQASSAARVTSPPLPSPSSLSQASARSSSLANPLPQGAPQVSLELTNAVNNLSPMAKALLHAARVAPEQFLKFWSMLSDEKAVALSQEFLSIQQLMNAPVQESPQSNLQQTQTSSVARMTGPPLPRPVSAVSLSPLPSSASVSQATTPSSPREVIDLTCDGLRCDGLTCDDCLMQYYYAIIDSNWLLIHGQQKKPVFDITENRKRGLVRPKVSLDAIESWLAKGRAEREEGRSPFFFPESVIEELQKDIRVTQKGEDQTYTNSLKTATLANEIYLKEKEERRVKLATQVRLPNSSSRASSVGPEQLSQSTSTSGQKTRKRKNSFQDTGSVSLRDQAPIKSRVATSPILMRPSGVFDLDSDDFSDESDEDVSELDTSSTPSFSTSSNSTADRGDDRGEGAFELATRPVQSSHSLSNVSSSSSSTASEVPSAQVRNKRRAVSSTCEECGKKFPSKSKLSVHLTEHTRNRRIQKQKKSSLASGQLKVIDPSRRAPGNIAQLSGPTVHCNVPGNAPGLVPALTLNAILSPVPAIVLAPVPAVPAPESPNLSTSPDHVFDPDADFDQSHEDKLTTSTDSSSSTSSSDPDFGVMPDFFF